MKINRQFQELHTHEQSSDWVLKQLIERDICLLYHQLSEYSSIMGDLYYGDVYALPYWDYLAFPGVDPEQRDFLRDGCLIMILAMASECIDGSGAYLVPHVAECLNRVAAVQAASDDTDRLAAIVRLALETVKDGAPEPPELADGYVWAHRRYVRRYFADRAKEFVENPYFGESQA